jgi:hypothetical protein
MPRQRYFREQVQDLARPSRTLPLKAAPMSLVGRLVEHQQPAKVATRYICMKLDALRGVYVARLIAGGYSVSYEVA